MKINKKMVFIFLIILFLSIFLFLLFSGFFRNFDEKIRYGGYSFKGTAKEMDALNEDSIKKSAEEKNLITVVIHGAGSEYYSDVFGTVLWFKEKKYNVVSFDYDYKADPIESTKKLSVFVDETLKKTGTKKINIYGICLGGIIARYYAEKLDGAQYINKLVTVVSPIIPLPQNEPAYLYDKYFSFNPEPWNNIIKELNEEKSVSQHLYIYCKKDLLVPAKYQHTPGGNFLGLNCDHSFVNVNPEILNVALNFFENK